MQKADCSCATRWPATWSSLQTDSDTKTWCQPNFATMTAASISTGTCSGFAHHVVGGTVALVLVLAAAEAAACLLALSRGEETHAAFAELFAVNLIIKYSDGEGEQAQQLFRYVPRRWCCRRRADGSCLHACSGSPSLPAEFGFVGAWTGGSHYQLVEFDQADHAMYEPDAEAAAAAAAAAVEAAGAGAATSSSISGGGAGSAAPRGSATSRLMTMGVSCQCAGTCTTNACKCRLNKKKCADLCHWNSHKERAKVTRCTNCDRHLQKVHAERYQQSQAAKQAKPAKAKAKGKQAREEEKKAAPASSSDDDAAAGSDDFDADDNDDDDDDDWRSGPAPASAEAPASVAATARSSGRSVQPTLDAALGRLNAFQLGFARSTSRSSGIGSGGAGSSVSRPAAASTIVVPVASAVPAAVAAVRAAQAASQAPLAASQAPMSLQEILNLRGSVGQPPAPAASAAAAAAVPGSRLAAESLPSAP